MSRRNPKAKFVENTNFTTSMATEPEHMQQLGQICINWANLELGMYRLFVLMTELPAHLATKMFYAIESNRARRELLLNTGKALLEKDKDLSDLDNLLRRIGKTGGQRNKYIHDSWMVMISQKKARVWQMRVTRGILQQVTIPDLKASADQIEKLTLGIKKFCEQIGPDVPALHEKLRKQRGVTLVYSPKGHPPGRLSKGHHARHSASPE